MKTTAKTLALVIAVTLIVTAGCYKAWTTAIRAAPAKAAQTYIQALATGDIDTALRTATGTAAWAAKNSHADKVQVVTLDTVVTEVRTNYAEVSVYAELQLADGSHDAGWYRLILVRSDQWRVVSVSENLWYSGIRRPVYEREQQEMVGTVEEYLSALTRGDHQEAVKRLCGPARRAHEQSEAVFKHLPAKSVGSVEVKPVWRRGNQTVCRAEYELDGRQVTVLVHLAKLSDGWRIAAISQI